MALAVDYWTECGSFAALSQQGLKHQLGDESKKEQAHAQIPDSLQSKNFCVEHAREYTDGKCPLSELWTYVNIGFRGQVSVKSIKESVLLKGKETSC